jgi:hypothetical protein
MENNFSNSLERIEKKFKKKLKIVCKELIDLNKNYEHHILDTLQNYTII